MKAALTFSAPPRSWARRALHSLWTHRAWEAAQCSVFYDMSATPFLQGVVLMVGATLADVLLTVLIVAAALQVSGHQCVVSAQRVAPLVSGLGVGAAMLIEAVALSFGWWRYASAMPVIEVGIWPIGLIPLLQLSLIPLLSFILASQRSRP